MPSSPCNEYAVFSSWSQKCQHLGIWRRLFFLTTASCQLGVSSGMLTGKWRSYPWEGFHLYHISVDGDVMLIQQEISGASTQFLQNRVFNPAAEQHRSSDGGSVCSRILTLLPALREQKCGPQAVVLKAVNTGTGLWPLLCAPNYGIPVLWVHYKSK